MFSTIFYSHIRFETQDHDEVSLTELVQNAVEYEPEDEPNEAKGASEASKEAEEEPVVHVDLEEIQGKVFSPKHQPAPKKSESVEPENIDVEDEKPRRPLNMKNGLQRSKTPETMVQLIDDIESSSKESDIEAQDEEASLAASTVQSPVGDQAEAETVPPAPSTPPKQETVLEKAKAGNEKRMARFLQNGDFYDSIKKGSTNQVQEERSMSSSTVTLPSPVRSFTPENNEEYTGGYNDILNVLERLEDETTKDEQEDKDSGRPQSESSNATGSPKRASTSHSNGTAAPIKRANSSSPSKMR